jgi:hypothetical protein
MRWMTIAFGLLAGLGLGADSPDPKEPVKLPKADVRGEVTQVTLTPGGLLVGTIHVDGKKEKDTTYASAVVTINVMTKIEKLIGGKTQAAKFEDIKKGSRVQAEFSGGVGQSDPVKGLAKSVLILEAAK